MEMGGGILALDLATSTGFAVADPRGRVFSGALNLGGISGRRGETLSRLEAWLDDQLMVHKPRAVVWEAPAVAGVPGAQERALLLLGMSAIVEKVAWQSDIPITRCVAANTVKKFFAGNGFAQKEDMLARARQLGFRPHSTDEADAIAVLCWASETLNMPVQFPGARAA